MIYSLIIIVPYNAQNYMFVFIYLHGWFLTAIHTSQAFCESWEHDIFL